ncbi:hypothetical protein JL720_4829 [Aureococcus anophagefferens]|nr:hypothetical protein JL720_4829 [Aureococcus anophagefferens]
MLSERGRCHTLDLNADGYCRGEGCGSFLLAADDYAVDFLDVAGTAVQQDGPSASLTAPNGSSQQRLLATLRHPAALLVALEAHGTGTALGDPIEVGAAVRAVCGGAGRAALSSLKSNMGHLEAAAAAGGLGVLLAVPLAGGVVPPNAQLRRLNGHVNSFVAKKDAPLAPVEASGRRGAA